MPAAPLPADEAERLNDLYRLEILDTESEACFDRITRIASLLAGTPMALISLIDQQRQWFKSRVGLDLSEASRADAFCGYTILGREPLVVLDATKDDRFSDNPFTAGEPKVRFYAGAPLVRGEGTALGTICVVDTEPRDCFNETQRAILMELAALVTDQMEQRLARLKIAESRRAQERGEMVRRKLQEAIRHAQSHFISGAEPEAVFAALLETIVPLIGSHAGCIASSMTEDQDHGPLRVAASTGEKDILSLMERAFTAGCVVRDGPGIALPAFHGDQVVGVIGFEQAPSGHLMDLHLELDPFLDSVAALFVASRARRQGRQIARAIRLRDRALASINSAVAIVDPQNSGGAILYVNAAFEAMSGFQADELAGRHLGLMNGPETSPDAIRSIEEALATGMEQDVTLLNYHRDGSSFWNRVRLSPVKDEAGRVEYFVSVGDDVTGKIEADNELRRAKEAAEKHARMASQFMANMSHEIRTPMNGVIGMTGLLLDSPLTEEQRDYAETIRSSGEGLLTIINEILDFSRIDSGMLQLEMQDFNLCHCVESAMDLVASAAARKSIDLEYLLDPGVPETIMSDATRLRQILINVLGNAVKFTSEGSVLLSVAGSRTGASEWELHFKVQDTGIGIPEERRSDIFEPFQQADNSSTRRYGGTGLGLAISKHLTELMGGKIWVESEVGRGSTFHFTVRARAEEPLAPGDTTPEKLLLEGRRVIVIDPNTVSQSVLRQHLQAWGLTAQIYPSAEAAAAAREDTRFDLAIVDNDLPDVSPEQITSLTANTPMVVLCSLGRRNSGLAEQLRGRSSPRVRLHSKPIKPSYLCETLVAFLSGEPVRVAQKSQPSLLDPEFARNLPYSILVVEDNAVNQKLVLLLLSRLGYRADTANNGIEAVRALQRQHYDVVLMDMHMPEMDGVEATRRIRELLPKEQQPWIISLTANAMQSDRNECLRAGMQNFITKPVQSLELRNALLNVKRKPTTLSSTPDPAPHKEAEEEWVIPDYLAELLAEDPATGAELLEIFAADTTRQLAELSHAVAEPDLVAAKKLLHGLKGSCGQMGALAIAIRCAGLEGQLASGIPADIRPEVAELSARCEGLLVQMNGRVAKLVKT